MKSNGVYVRQGASSVQASPEQIRRMIKDSDGDIFEEMRTVVQELSFEEAKHTFTRYKVDFSEEKYIALGLRNIDDDQYTNLAMLLSDQCQHTTKIAVFGDEANITFKDAKEFCGSIFKQLDDSYAYLMLCNRTAATFKGLERVEISDYPEAALREALLNALVHRDYNYSGSIIINVNDFCIEFISIGGLLPGLSADDIRNGISQPRIEVTTNTFKLILPNMNARSAITEHVSEASEKPPVTITPQMKMAIDYLNEYGEMTEEDLQELLNIKKTRAYLLTRQMSENGLIDIIGRGAAKKYKLSTNQKM